MIKNFFIRPIIFLALILSFMSVANAQPRFTMEVNGIRYQNDNIFLVTTIKNLGDMPATVTGVDINKIIFKYGKSQKGQYLINSPSIYRNLSIYIPAGGAVTNLFFPLQQKIYFQPNDKTITCKIECTFYWQ